MQVVTFEDLDRVPAFSPVEALTVCRRLMRTGADRCPHNKGMEGNCGHLAACCYGFSALGFNDASSAWFGAPRKYKRRGLDKMVKAPAGAQTGGPPRGTTPVEIAVTGAGALASTRTDQGDRVDVVVSGDSSPGPSAGRTYVAASGIPLLGLREAQAEPGLASDRWIATLALTREEALVLIRAESVGAQVRLLAK